MERKDNCIQTMQKTKWWIKTKGRKKKKKDAKQAVKKQESQSKFC